MSKQDKQDKGKVVNEESYPILNHYSISGFLRSLTEKNYAEANKYLKKAVENKLSDKIKGYKNINIFNNE